MSKISLKNILKKTFKKKSKKVKKQTAKKKAAKIKKPALKKPNKVKSKLKKTIKKTTKVDSKNKENKTDKQRRLYLACVISKIILSYNYTVETPDIKEYLSEKMNLRYTKKQSQTHKKFASHELITSIYIHSAQYISQTQVEIFGVKHTTTTRKNSLNPFRGIVSLQEI